MEGQGEEPPVEKELSISLEVLAKQNSLMVRIKEREERKKKGGGGGRGGEETLQRGAQWDS